MKRKKQKVLDNHQRCWVWGRRAVTEILLAGHWPVLELHLAETLSTEEKADAHELAKRQATLVHVEPAERLRQLCKAADHQGHLAKMAPFPYADASELIERFFPTGAASKTQPSPLFVILDAIQDSFNFGAIARSAEALSVDALIIGERRQAAVNSMVARTSAGAINRLPIARVPALPELAQVLLERGAKLVGASEKAATSIADFNFRQPAAIIFGNESDGISPQLSELCHELIGVPQQGAIGSLNVAAAAAIALYEAGRQRQLK